MKLSCALVLTLANLVIATPYSFSAKGSGASAQAEAVTSHFGQFAAVKPVASKTSGFSGSFSKSSSASFASNSASSSASAFNYNAGQVGTASLAYGSPGIPKPSKGAGHHVPQATVFATAGSNVQAGASADAQSTGSYSSQEGNGFSVNTNGVLNSQYQSLGPENKPSSHVGLSSGIPGYWHENSKPNNLNTNVPEYPENVPDTPGVQSFSSEVQSGTAFPSTPSTPSQVTVSVEKAPSYTGGFGGPPGFLNPHDKISSVGSNTPGQNIHLTYQPGAQIDVPNKQQHFINTPVSTINPSYAQNEGPKGDISHSIQPINNDYVYHTVNSKPEVKPAYLDKNKPTASSSYETPSSELKPNDGQYFALQPQTEITYTTDKIFEQVPHSGGQYSSHSNKPLTNSHGDSKPIKNIQIFIQPIPSNAPQTSSNPVHFTNTQLGSESNKEVKPNNQYTGSFNAPAGILKPSGQSVSSSHTYTSYPVKIEQYESSPIGLTTTGAKETTYGTGFGASSNDKKTTAQPSLQSFDSGSSTTSYVTPKPSSSKFFPSIPSASVSNEYESTEQKGTEQYLGKPSESSLLNPTVSSWVQNQTPNSLHIKPEFEAQNKPIGPVQSISLGEVSEDVKPTIHTNNAFVYSNTPYKPVVTSAPYDTNKPNYESTNQKESAFVSFTTTQPTPVHSWQQSTYKPSFEGLSAVSSTPGYSENRETYPTKYPSLLEDYTISKESEKAPSGTYSNVASPTGHFQSTSNLNHQPSYGSTAASFVAQEPTAQVNFDSPTLTGFSQQTSYKPSIQNSLGTSSASEFSESTITSPSERPSTSAFSVSKEVNKVPTQIVSNNAYPHGSVASIHLYPNSETSQSQSTSDKHHQSTNYGSTASFVTQKPTTSENFVGQTPSATSGLTSTSFSQQSNKPTVENSFTTGSLSGSSVSSNVSPTQKPLYIGGYSVSKESQTTPTYTTSNEVYPTVSNAHAPSPNSFSGKPQAQSSVSQQFVEYRPSSSFVTKEPTASVPASQTSQTVSSTSAISESTTFSQQSPYKPSVVSSSATSSVSGLPEIPKTSPSKNPTFTTDYSVSKETQKTPSAPSSSVAYPSGGVTSAFTTNWFSGKPQNQFPTKPAVETGTQKQPLYSNTFGTLTGAVRPSSYSSPSSTGYPWSTSSLLNRPSYVTGTSDKPKQTTNFNQNKPTISSFPEKKETLNPYNQPYSTGSTYIASNIPTTAKPSHTVASLNVVQQSTSSLNSQKEKESTITTSGSDTTYSKPTPQTILNNSGVSSTSYATSKPTKPTNQLSTGNSAFSSFGSSSLSQIKPQYQFSTVQPVTQRKQWNTNNYGTFGAVKPHSYTYPGFTSSFTSFGHGSSSVGGLYDKTKQATQYTSTGQYKPTSTGQYSPTSTGQYNPSLTGQYKPTSTGPYKPTYNWGFTGQSGSQKPSYQSTQTGGSFISTYTQTTGKPIVTPSPFDKLKPTSDFSVVTQKESGFSSSFASSSGATKPTNQPQWSEIHESHQTNTDVSSASSVTLKPTSSESSYDSVTGSPLLADISDKGQVTSTNIFTTPTYDFQKPTSATGQTVSNTYLTSSFISSKPTADLPTKLNPQENKPSFTYTEQHQVVPSVQTTLPTKDVENSEFSQSLKPVSSSSNQKESSYTSYTGVTSSNLNPNSPHADHSNISHFVDKTPTTPVKPTSSVSQPFSPGVIYQGNTEFHSNSQVQPTKSPVDLTPKKPEYPSTFGESSVQFTPPKQGSLGVSSGQKESVSTGYYPETNVHSKPANTPAAGSISGYFDQQNVNPKITPTLQETHSNIAGAFTTKPPGQYWVLNSQSTSQQTAFQATKPNISGPGKPSGTIVSPSYAGGFGGPSGILKPNDFSISSNQGNIQSQYQYPSHSHQASSGAYSGPKVTTSSYTTSYTGGFGGPSGVLKPDEKHSAINHAVHDKPSLNGFYPSPSQGGAQASYNVASSSSTSGAQGYIKEQTANGAQVSAEVQGNPAANAAANASGFVNSDVYASSTGFDKNSNAYGGQFGGINGFSTDAKGSATASATSSGFGGSYTSNSATGFGSLPHSPGGLASILGRR